VKRRQRWLAAVAVVVAIGLVAGGVTVRLALDRAPRVEILVHDVALVQDRPEDGMTELHAFLVLRNPTPSIVRMEWIVLTAYDPEKGTVFDTFVHGPLTIDASATQAFSEVAELTGLWSDVAFEIRIFQEGRPRWEAPVEPGEPIVWRPA